MKRPWRKPPKPDADPRSGQELLSLTRSLPTATLELLMVAVQQSEDVASVLLGLADEERVQTLLDTHLIELDGKLRPTPDAVEMVSALRLLERDERTATTPVTELTQELHEAVRRLELAGSTEAPKQPAHEASEPSAAREAAPADGLDSLSSQVLRLEARKNAEDYSSGRGELLP